MSAFTHLHLHTQYSLLDGAIRVKDLFPKVQELGMDTVAVTDHGNMFGAIDLYTAAKEHGVKLIFGCETYVAATDRADRTNRRNYHLVLLAKDEVGYKNLSYLNSMGYLEGFYYNPRIDKQILREHAEGLIGMSACLGGEVAQTLSKHERRRGRDGRARVRGHLRQGQLLPRGDAATAWTEQQQLNDDLRQMSKKLDIPLVATNDCHYVNQSDAARARRPARIQTGKSLQRRASGSSTRSIATSSRRGQMEADFPDLPDALREHDRHRQALQRQAQARPDLPAELPVPDETSRWRATWRRWSYDGLERRFREMTGVGRAFDPDQYRERCRVELGVIQKMDFSGYFLIVWDFINWAKEHGIPVGPGRGSGAGSCVAWAMRITDIDPLEFKLLFERFLNPERIVDAGLRRRLLHEPARRGHRLRQEEVRREATSARSRPSTSSRRAA